MSTRIYVDACIYLDYFEERSNGMRPLSEFAFRIFQRAFECEFEIVISEWLLRELRIKKEFETKARLLFDDLRNKNKLIQTDADDKDEKEAKSYKNWKDALHCILARKAKCEFIITRNIEHFSSFSDILKAKLPEQI
ncbi:MAG: PIN domain-containing protein [Candidatus Diapherotrites archaeon]|uniref:PIN domain-containing protein n=1 Tax=Candidatus Iainarchaeum sp. TaxID=3101447 RepID=A0A8T4KU45_9ARCH|nr:PIN domain-containing protein [Candidatus Diapherotrites archaeon]